MFQVKATLARLLQVSGVRVVMVLGLLWIAGALNQDVSSDDPERFRFKMEAGGIKFTDDGFQISIEGYRAKDGMSLSHHIWSPLTGAKPLDAFRRELAQSHRIVEQETLKDGDGQPVGERAVAYFWNEDVEVAAVLWADANTLRVVRSLSMEHVLEFERQLRQ